MRKIVEAGTVINYRRIACSTVARRQSPIITIEARAHASVGRRQPR